MDIVYKSLLFLLLLVEMVIANTMEKANQLLAQGRMPEAADAYSEVINKDKTNYQALYRRATVYLALGKTKNALPDLNGVLEIRPDFTQAKVKRGDLYIKQGDYDKAAVDFDKDAEKRQLIQELKEHDKAYHAAMYQKNGHKIAIEHLTALLESSPWSVEYLEARAECYEHRGLYDDAILDLRPTTKLVNDNTKAWQKISLLHYYQGEIERSLETIRECLILDQQTKPHKMESGRMPSKR
jgi:DnaJ family protein C protein 3